MFVALVALALAWVAAAAGAPAAGWSLLAIAGLCALASGLLVVRLHRAARAQMVGMIDAHLEARAAQGRPDTEDDARKRAEILAVRQRLSR
jgi:hypothetical protein